MNLLVVLHRRRRRQRRSVGGEWDEYRDEDKRKKITTRIISYSCKRVLFYYILTRPHYARGLFELITQGVCSVVYIQKDFFSLSPTFKIFFSILPNVQGPTKMQIEMSLLPARNTATPREHEFSVQIFLDFCLLIYVN